MYLPADELLEAVRSWEGRVLVFGTALFAVVLLWEAGTLRWRLVRDGLVFLVGPLALAAVHGRNIGWRVDRRALRWSVGLTAFVLPFYIIGSTFPTVRAAYPMYGAAVPTLPAFIPTAVGLVVLVVATETYFRGLLCVGLGSWGRVAILVHLPFYVIRHLGQPPLEVALSGPAGVLFGVAAYETESILPPVAAHGVGVLILDWLTRHPPLFDASRWLGLLV